MLHIISIGTLILLLWVGIGVAQTPIVINLDTSRLIWDWTQGSGGVATEFRVKCGTVAGTYPLTKRVALPTKELAVKAVITQPGRYVCVVTAANTQTTPIAESTQSNKVWIDVPRLTPVLPTAPGDLRVVAP